jgi:CheY-like chemotaxis protein
VANGLEVLEALRKVPYALILMDCQMPEMDGFAATAAIRALPSDISRIVIIAMTAHAMQGNREKCLAVGMDDYLSKPVAQKLLSTTLKKWMPEAELKSVIKKIGYIQA